MADKVTPPGRTVTTTLTVTRLVATLRADGQPEVQAQATGDGGAGFTWTCPQTDAPALGAKVTASWERA